MDEEGNLGYYLYDESTGEEKLFSVVEDEKLYANTRKLKHAMKAILDRAQKGKLTTKDLERYGHLKGKNSIKAVTNPNYEKVAKGGYNKINKITRGKFGEAISKPDFISQSRENTLALMKNGVPKLNKGDVRSVVEGLNQAFK